LDILTTYVPHLADLFVPGSLGGPDVFPGVFRPGSWSWSLFCVVPSVSAVYCAVVIWAIAALFLVVGFVARISAMIAWVIAVSMASINPYATNAGDAVRTIILFFLMLSPCSAVWSIDAFLRRDRDDTSAVYVHPWALRLLFLQLVVIYFCNGLHKNIPGSDWWTGETVYAIIANLGFARLPYNLVPVPYVVTQFLTWAIFFFELGFPVWIAIPRTRTAALVVGAAFHIGLAVFMELIMFPAYMLCLYLPLVPWERVPDRWKRSQGFTGKSTTS
jgi:hypothetical protein